MKVTLDLDKLLEDGEINQAEYEKLSRLSAGGTTNGTDSGRSPSLKTPADGKGGRTYFPLGAVTKISASPFFLYMHRGKPLCQGF